MKNQSDCPKYMRTHIFERSFKLKESKKDYVWSKLQKRETFTRGQIPPYRVEFDSNEQSGDFEEGELNIHHGPFLSVHGHIGKISEDYRDLSYLYGSYVISFRLVRPTRLEFFKKEDGIHLKISSYVHPKFIWFWEKGNHFFWKFFGISFLI